MKTVKRRRHDYVIFRANGMGKRLRRGARKLGLSVSQFLRQLADRKLRRMGIR